MYRLTDTRRQYQRHFQSGISDTSIGTTLYLILPLTIVQYYSFDTKLYDPEPTHTVKSVLCYDLSFIRACRQRENSPHQDASYMITNSVLFCFFYSKWSPRHGHGRGKWRVPNRLMCSGKCGHARSDREIYGCIRLANIRSLNSVKMEGKGGKRGRGDMLVRCLERGGQRWWGLAGKIATT